MSKKILILEASGRPHSNSGTMADTFAVEAEKKGYKVDRVNTINLAIKPCRGCGKCYTKDNPCVFDDDFKVVAPKLIEADVVVFATPVYWYNFPAQLTLTLTLVIDKFITVTWGRIPMVGKKCVLLTCAEKHNPAYVFEEISATYDKVTKFMRWESIGKVMQHGVWDAGDIKKTNALAMVTELVEAL